MKGTFCPGRQISKERQMKNRINPENEKTAVYVSLCTEKWKKCQVLALGKNKTTQLASLRKKKNEYFISKAHAICVNQVDACKHDTITKSIDKANEKYIISTCKVFNTVYSLAKRFLLSFPQNCSKNSHTANDIRDQIFSKIMEKGRKICVIVDEASTISSKPVPIIYHRCLVETLKSVGFGMDFLKKNLIAFCSDRTSVMLGQSSGVGVRQKKNFSSIILWHCLNHRLQLVLDDAIKKIKQVNHFKIFMDKIYSIFHQSNKNQMQLYIISQQLGQEILKIGRVLGPRWAACS
ncbi:E3 SUMO-protein ligase KIAA1586-like [Hydra vulgaris]|uniref:E3 SUMO-protein ligase KIAA1586-like n=1 Tax=Hydra vulgaris TaxID=6087 RepID=A0ABM4BNC6_HYDVU